PVTGRARAPRGLAGGPRREGRAAPRLQLPPGVGTLRATSAARAARPVHPRLRAARRAARAPRRLQRVAPRSHHARPPARVLVADAPDAAHASGDVPAVRPRPDLLGRGAPGSGVPCPPEPPRAGGLRPPAGGRP